MFFDVNINGLQFPDIDNFKIVINYGLLITCSLLMEVIIYVHPHFASYIKDIFNRGEHNAINRVQIQTL